MVPRFLELPEVLEIHQDQIDRYGGSHGVRDLGLLKSALAMPRAAFGGRYFHSDIFEMAAAYLFHVAKNHPFVDGNKRAGAMAAFVFLGLNGYSLSASEEAFERIVLSVVEGKTDKAGIAEFFRTHASRRKGTS